MGSALRETDALTADCRSSRFVHFAKSRKAVFRRTVLIACVAFMLYGLTKAESLRGKKHKHGGGSASCTVESQGSEISSCKELKVKVKGHHDGGEIACQINEGPCFSGGQEEMSGRTELKVDKKGGIEFHVDGQKQEPPHAKNGTLSATIDPGQNKVKVKCDKEKQAVPEHASVTVNCTGVHT